MKENFYYDELVVPSVIAFWLLFVEASINLTYYKDCIFAVGTLICELGMYYTNYTEKIKEFDRPIIIPPVETAKDTSFSWMSDDSFANDSVNELLGISISWSTLNQAKLLCMWLLAITVLTAISILTTLL